MIEALGSRAYKTYRIYEKSLGAGPGRPQGPA
jgi:hypothetical protein